MQNTQLARRLVAAVGVSVTILAGALTACGKDEQPAPPTSPSTSTSAPTPTEKSINPTGGNLFTPQVKAPPAPTGVPGTNHTG